MKRKRDDFEANIVDILLKIDSLNVTYTTEYAKEEACKAIEGHSYTLKDLFMEVTCLIAYKV